MTSKIQISEEAVCRAHDVLAAVGRLYGDEHGLVRKALEAALNPPEEPEIPVSEAMKEAGRLVALSCGGSTSHYTMEEIYVAMEKARRKEDQKNPAYGKHRRHDDDSGYIPPLYWRHRRKDDPK